MQHLQQKKWLEENQESLALILEASTRESCAFLNPASATYGESIGVFKSNEMYKLLLFSARKLESENQLDEAFEHYSASLRLARHLAQRGRIHDWFEGRTIQFQTLNWIGLWTGHPQQTKQRLKEAIDQIRTETDAFPSPAEAVTIEYGILRRTFLEEPDVLLENFSSSGKEFEDILLAFLWQFCPWERTRSVELLELLTVDELNYFRKLQVHLDRRGIDMVQWLSQYKVYFSGQMGRIPPWSLLPTTPLLSRFVSSRKSNLGLGLIETKTRREATLLMLALIAYRKEHGELPRRLDQLVGEYFKELPLDPWSGREFGYEPDGFPTAVRFSNHTSEPAEPVLWSAGSSGGRLLQVGKTEQNQPKYLVVPHHAWDYETIPEERRSGYGRAFPIPE